MRQLPAWFAHYNDVSPAQGSRISFTVSSSQLMEVPDRVRSFGGYNSFSEGLVVLMTYAAGPSK
jgi:hypothetical protein